MQCHDDTYIARCVASLSKLIFLLFDLLQQHVGSPNREVNVLLRTFMCKNIISLYNVKLSEFFVLIVIDIFLYSSFLANMVIVSDFVYRLVIRYVV